MRKMIIICLTTVFLFNIGSAIADKVYLRNNVIRLHVIAHSDDDEDQRVKLEVKNALKESMHDMLQNCESAEAALRILNDNIDELESVANQTLRVEGSDHTAQVSIREVPFGIRKYDTFTLPSGIYQSVQVSIGNAEGKNWWCVVFPALCETVATEQLESVAVDAGFSDSLSDTISEDGDYEIRFWLLDLLGKLEIIFHKDVK